MRLKRLAVISAVVALFCGMLQMFDYRLNIFSQNASSSLAAEVVSPEGTYIVRVYQQRVALSSDSVWCEYAIVDSANKPVVFFDQYGAWCFDIDWVADDIIVVNGVELKLPFSRFKGQVYR